AFYVQLIWKYKDHPPYFGLSFGNIKENLASIDLDRWNDPQLSEARRAKDILKNNSKSESFHFSLSRLPDTQGIHQYKSEMEVMLNTTLGLMQELVIEQTEIQALV